MKNVITTEVDSITTDHIQTLCLDGEDAALLKGKRVLVVDDVISTGESLKSMMTLIDMIGDVEVVAQMAVLAEGSAADRDDIVFLEKLPLFDAQGNPL